MAIRFIRATTAMYLALWVAGAGCIFGCENMIATAAAKTHSTHHSTTIVAEGHACASRKTPDCCQKNDDEVERESTQKSSMPVLLNQPSSRTMNACPLAAGRATIVNKTRNADTNVSPALVPETFNLQNSAEQKSSLATPLRLPNRGHTYLHCCVFLI